MATDPDLAKERAAARADKAREVEARREQIRAEDDAALQRELTNTARLKALRLAKEAAEREAMLAAAAVKSAAAAAKTAAAAAKKASPKKRKVTSA